MKIRKLIGIVVWYIILPLLPLVFVEPDDTRSSLWGVFYLSYLFTLLLAPMIWSHYQMKHQMNQIFSALGFSTTKHYREGIYHGRLIRICSITSQLSQLQAEFTNCTVPMDSLFDFFAYDVDVQELCRTYDINYIEFGAGESKDDPEIACGVNMLFDWSKDSKKLESYLAIMAAVCQIAERRYGR
jgi:hypothetical protein